MMRARIITVLILLIGGSGCAREASSQPPIQNHRFEQRSLTFTVTAPVEASFSGRYEMQFFERTSDDPKFWNMRLATISTNTPIDIGSRVGLIIGISLVGDYEGAGTYEVEPRGDVAKPKPGQVPDLSVIRIETYDLSQPVPVLIERWDNTTTCRVTIDGDATAGSLRCPSDGSDRGFDVRMGWRDP